MKAKITNVTLGAILFVFLTGYQLQASGITERVIINEILLITNDENPLKTIVSVHVKGGTVTDFFNLLKEKTGGKLSFVYVADDIAEIKSVTLDYDSISVEQLLSILFEKYPNLTYSVDNNVVAIKKKVELKKERVNVLGKVVNATSKKPIVGATVIVVGTNNGSITDNNGGFTLSANTNDALDISYVGMKPINYTTPLGNGELIIEMEEDVFAVDNVIVTGYQKLSSERSTGSFAVINKDDIEGRLDVSLMDRLEGMVAGLTQRGETIEIRGKSTISGVSRPLFVVDGVPFEGDIDLINPSEIVNVTVLKDATAASIYGARSANGVIVITTRNGSAGPTKVRYNGSVLLSGLPDTDYLNLMSSSEFVDFQETLFTLNSGARPQANLYLNEVRQVLFDHKEGKITDGEKETRLNQYRNSDNEQQIIDEFLRKTQITHQHNLSVSGGSEKHTYALSMNYLQNLPYEKVESDDKLGFNLKNSFKFSKWFTADVALLGSIYNKNHNKGFSGYSTYKGTKPSYLMLRDELGDELPWYQAKSQSEIDRLKGLNLLDEAYYPIMEMNEKYINENENTFNANINLNFKIMEGLSVDLRYQNEYAAKKSKDFASKDSYDVKTMVNNATQIVDGKIIQNIPTGGQVTESRSDRNSYTMRAQVNFDRNFGSKHSLSVIAGSEIRRVKSSAMSSFKVGFDDNSLSYKVIDEKMLGKTIKGTQSTSGSFTYSKNGGAFGYKEDRYVSFYANASYTFNERLTTTASIRMDQSNLFGTDPKYQYRPLWSFGAQYLVSKNKYEWLDRLSVRATYGINGNIAKTSGPYLTVKDGGTNPWTNDYSSQIILPPNSGLRWEKTGVFNLAVDFNTLKSRLNGSIEFYNKNTTDLLYNKEMDPTYGWNLLMVNYGDMYNRGIEISLNSKNIEKNHFIWTSRFNFSYNKNKLTRIENNQTDAIYYIQNNQIREGLPMNSLYSVRWAGLDEKGAPQAYNKDGEKVNSFAKLGVDDLIYSGISVPPYSASLSNTLRYKTLSLSFMFIYNGGNVMRGAMGSYINGTGISANQDRLTGNFWQKPGDEKDPSKAPAYKQGVDANTQNLWKAADRHIQKADYIKLSNITVGYDLPSHLFKNWFLGGATVTFQAQDVWKWVANDQGLDPEVWTGTTLTPSRGLKLPASYSIGLSLNF